MIGDRNIKKKHISLPLIWMARGDFLEAGTDSCKKYGFYIWTFDVFVSFVCVKDYEASLLCVIVP